jgi:hypothetical protein
MSNVRLTVRVDFVGVCARKNRAKRRSRPPPRADRALPGQAARREASKP